jgi:hypothetical protein
LLLAACAGSTAAEVHVAQLPWTSLYSVQQINLTKSGLAIGEVTVGHGDRRA